MDKIRCLINMITAFIIYPFTKGKFKNRKIWLVGGNAGELFVDNGRAIYEYLRSKKDIEEYWVVNKNSPVFDKIHGGKLVKGSVESYLYFMNSEVVLFSHSISADIVPYLFVVPIINMFHYKTLKVFLNHGTVGFKVRMPMNRKTGKIAEKLVKSYDINICDSEYEKNIKTKTWWNVPENSAFITGYPRYDKLYDVEVERKEILFMPTWRNWIKLENTMRMRIAAPAFRAGTFPRITNSYTNAHRNDESGLRIHPCVAAARFPLSAHARGFSDKNYFSSSSFFFGLKSTPASLRCCGVIGAGAAVSGS